VASGNAPVASSEGLPLGYAVTSSGRISGVCDPSEQCENYPFSIADRIKLDEALKWGTRASKARFAVYIGNLGSNPTDAAGKALGRVPTPDDALLLAVSPNQRIIEVVYGANLRGRGAEQAATLGVAAAKSGFAEGNLIDGLVSAIRVMSAAIARP
jgi:hypothetical protein